MCRQKFLALIAALTLAGPAALGISQEVVRPQQAGGTLAARMDWAHKEASSRGCEKGFWTGYSIRRLMGENSSIGSFDNRSRSEATLEEILSGKRAEYPNLSRDESVRQRARRELDNLEKEGRPEKKVWKDVAILMQYGNASKVEPVRVDMSNLDLHFDLRGLPLFWLGEAADEESLDWLNKAYRRTKSEDVKEHFLAAVGIHQNPGLVIPILDSVLKSQETDDLRKHATFWLGQQNDRKAYDILMQTARKDRSGEVQEGAVFAISQIDLEESVDGLIGLAKSADDEEVRKKAVFWLGQKASNKATEALKNMAYEGGDTKIQEQAVFALSQLPGNEGVEALIKIVKTHPSAEVRKKAIFWLGETGDPRALDVLIEIVKGK
jgi:HEAT repeat protein